MADTLQDSKNRFLEAAYLYGEAVETDTNAQWYWRGELESAAVDVEFRNLLKIGGDLVEFQAPTRELYVASSKFVRDEIELDDLCEVAAKWYVWRKAWPGVTTLKQEG
jgi:hypothetical protein